MIRGSVGSLEIEYSTKSEVMKVKAFIFTSLSIKSSDRGVNYFIQTSYKCQEMKRGNSIKKIKKKVQPHLE